MHNAPLLMRGGRTQRAVMHVDDAADRLIADGDTIAVSSAHGRIALPVSLTDGIVRGTVAIPHGWGQRGERGLAIGQSGRGGQRQPADVQRSF